MKKRITLRQRLMLSVALVLALTMSLAGCGGQNSAQSDGTDSSGAAAVGELRIGLPGSMATLDVTQTGGIIDYYVLAVAQEGLVSVSNDGKLVPGLAESWTVSDDGKTYVFKLREGVKFSDGSDLTAEDVVYSVTRAGDPDKSPGTAGYYPWYIQDVKATAAGEVTFTLDGPRPGFLWNVSNAGTAFISSQKSIEAAESYGSPTDLITGTGPYKPSEFEPGSHVTFVRSDTWRGEKPAFDSIRFDFIEDANTRLLAFQGGDIDFTYNIPQDAEAQWKKVDGANVSFVADRSYQGITFNPNIAPFDDIHVRRAIGYAIDKDSIVNGLIGGHATAATAITPPDQLVTAWDKAKAEAALAEVPHYDFDIAKAKEEIAQSKSPNGFKAELTYPASDPNLGKVSLAIADSLKQIGIELDVKETPLEQWLANVSNGEQGIAWMSYTPTTGDPAEITSWLLYADGESNPAFWKNDLSLTAMDSSLSAPDVAKEAEYVMSAEKVSGEEAIYLPVYWGQSGVAFAKGVSVDNYNSYTLVANWPFLFQKGE